MVVLFGLAVDCSAIAPRKFSPNNIIYKTAANNHKLCGADKMAFYMLYMLASFDNDGMGKRTSGQN